MSRLRPQHALLVIVPFAVLELLYQRSVIARVPSDADWRNAAAFVRAAHQATDLVTSAPRWTDPIVREVAGDMISLRDAGRDDLAAYDRLWVLSIRGKRSPEAPNTAPELERDFGRVHVTRYRLPRASVLLDLGEHLDDATKTIVQDGQERPCTLRNTPYPGGVGLNNGPVRPAKSYQCDAARDWLWIGETVFEDSAHQPRRCVWTHPAGAEPIRITYHDVPLGESIVVYGGLQRDQAYDDHTGRVHVQVKVQGEPVGDLFHPPGPGWSRMEASTRSPGRAGADRGEVTLEISAQDPEWRHFCWSATIRNARGSAR